MLNNKFLFIFLVWFCLFKINIQAQQYNFKNYSTKNGMVGSYINHIFQDSKGFLWFATSSGVSLFDGKSFKNFTIKDGLPSNDVTYINEDKKNQIWIATIRGVSRYNGRKFFNYTTKQGLTNDEVFCVYVDHQNKIWLATNGGGINIIEGNKILKLTSKDGLPNDKVFSILQDKNGNYWFSMRYGIVKYDGNHFGDYDTSKSFNKQLFFTSVMDSKGNLWFGGDGGVLKHDGYRFEKFDLPPKIKGMVNNITEDCNGNIWFATENGALKYEGKTFKLFDEKQGLSLNFVLSIKSDYEGNIWIGTNGSGVNLFNNESFINYTDKEGLNSKAVNCITSDKENNLYYIGTGSGLNIFNPNHKNTINELNAIQELNGVNVNCIYIDKKDMIWIGIEDGICIIEKNGQNYGIKKIIRKIGDKKLENVLKILQDKYGTYWIGTQSNGAFSINDNEAKSYYDKKYFDAKNILTLYEDFQGNIWFGTQDAGIFKYDRKTFKKFASNVNFEGKKVWAIAQDNLNHLFFGTAESGLFCYDGKAFINYTTANGLASNCISLLQWDNRNKCLWAGSDKGINKVKFNNKLSISHLRTYGEQEGFKGIEVTPNSSFIDKQGLFWIGSINGLCCYNYKYDLPISTATRLYFSDIKLNYKKADWNNYKCSIDHKTNLPLSLELDYKHNHLTFYFQALTTNKVKYTYMLEGQDENWAPLTENTFADYSNVSSGKSYKFKVKAINSFGKWSNEALTFQFKINSPWYDTWLAYFFYLISGVCIIVLILGYRTSALKKRQIILEEIVHSRTIELKEEKKNVEKKNTEILSSIEYAKRIQSTILPPLSEIKSILPQNFVLYLPKDIVAGDFYWMKRIHCKLEQNSNEGEEIILIAVCDSTGHGVPGALVSIVCSKAMDQAVKEFELTEPSVILDKVSELVSEDFSKNNHENDEIKDGMDVSLLSINKSTNVFQWAGANNGLIIVDRNGNLVELKPDKQPIGKSDSTNSFKNHKFSIEKDSCIYLYSDGFADQFGGPFDKKYQRSRLKDFLVKIQAQNMENQYDSLLAEFNSWKGDNEQVDDVCIIGIKW
jgi:ligand-binding sensor domain-containing protein/serine phosphatase RsbU (regulator of sigma subunit)